jgi:hypothetical protein
MSDVQNRNTVLEKLTNLWLTRLMATEAEIYDW